MFAKLYTVKHFEHLIPPTSTIQKSHKAPISNNRMTLASTRNIPFQKAIATTKIRMELGLQNFWNFENSQLILIDDEYHVINGRDCGDFNFPQSIRHHYTGVREPGNE